MAVFAVIARVPLVTRVKQREIVAVRAALLEEGGPAAEGHDVAAEDVYGRSGRVGVVEIVDDFINHVRQEESEPVGLAKPVVEDKLH